MKARLSSLKVREGGLALLDGGAIHCFRKAVDEAEWAKGQEVNVELAASTVVLRLLPWTVPLGVLISLGYEAVWEKSRFERPKWDGF